MDRSAGGVSGAGRSFQRSQLRLALIDLQEGVRDGQPSLLLRPQSGLCHPPTLRSLRSGRNVSNALLDRSAGGVGRAAKLRRSPDVLRDFNGSPNLLPRPPRRFDDALKPPLCGDQHLWVDVRLQPQRLNAGRGLDGCALVLLKGANLARDVAIHKGRCRQSRRLLRYPGVRRQRLKQPRVGELQLVPGEALRRQLLGLGEPLDGLRRPLDRRLGTGVCLLRYEAAIAESLREPLGLALGCPERRQERSLRTEAKSLKLGGGARKRAVNLLRNAD